MIQNVGGRLIYKVSSRIARDHLKTKQAKVIAYVCAAAKSVVFQSRE